MNRALTQRHAGSLLDDSQTCGKLSLNERRNRAQDHTRSIDEAASRFRYEECRDLYWNPEEFSLLWGTPLWDEASSAERVLLNQLYWVAYYAQIISAEIATILLNQTAAAGLYTYEDFRLVCDLLDLETSQERAHIHAFKTIGESVEAAVFGERVFTYPMRSMYAETMIFADTTRLREWWRGLQLRAFTALSSGNAFLGSQYFTIRGLRTLNGKMVQQALGRLAQGNGDAAAAAPVPSQISQFHFLDESYHFASSCILSHDVPRSLRAPTTFERWVVNRGVLGCQRDHASFSVAVRGIFWYDPALFPAVLRMLRSRAFGMTEREALEMIRRCFTEESEGLHKAFALHRTAVESYRAYVDPLPFITRENKAMALMGRATITGYLRETRRAFASLARGAA